MSISITNPRYILDVGEKSDLTLNLNSAIVKIGKYFNFKKLNLYHAPHVKSQSSQSLLRFKRNDAVVRI